MKIADMHGDTIYELLTRRRAGNEVFLRENELHMDLQKMKKADYLRQNVALCVGLKEDVNPYEEAKAEYVVFADEMENIRDEFGSSEVMKDYFAVKNNGFYH